MTLAIVALVGGLLLLIAGAESFVRGASRLAGRLGISQLVIGLTVVALGTSAPEVAVSVQSALAGAPELALGNVVGSNICNVLLILGIAAVIAPLSVAQQLVRVDVPVMIGVSLLIFPLARNGVISRLEGVLLCAGAVAYLTFLVVTSLRGRRVPEHLGRAPSAAAPSGRGESPLASLTWVGAGLALLVLGARSLVWGAVALAQAQGVSELVIGLTVVAVGTSLPEVATSVVAMLRGERDIAVGNVVGSNILNILLVLGASAAVGAEGIPVAAAALRIDIPVMVAVAVACLPIFFTGHRIDRWEGLLFLGYYGAYLGHLMLATTRHDALPAFSAVMGLFVIPLTALTLAVISYRAFRRDGPERRRE